MGPCRSRSRVLYSSLVAIHGQIHLIFRASSAGGDKKVSRLRKISYSQRLERLKLTTLEKRRIRGSLIEIYKILTGKNIVSVSKEQFFRFPPSDHSTRALSLNVATHRSSLDVRKPLFSQRTVNEWNALPQSVVDETTVNTFKAHLDKHWKVQRY